MLAHADGREPERLLEYNANDRMFAIRLHWGGRTPLRLLLSSVKSFKDTRDVHVEGREPLNWLPRKYLQHSNEQHTLMAAVSHRLATEWCCMQKCAQDVLGEWS